MTWKEFIELQERVDWGEEFSFDYKETEYWIIQNGVASGKCGFTTLRKFNIKKPNFTINCEEIRLF